MRSLARPFQESSDDGLLFPLGGVLLDERPLIIELGATPSEPLLLLTIRLRYPDRLRPADRLRLQVLESDRPLLSKYLHQGDPDLFLILKPRAGSPRLLTVGWPGEPTVPFEVSLEGASQADSSEVVIEAEPNNHPEEATPFSLGATVFASADDRPLVPAPGQAQEEAKAAGVDWYFFRLEGGQERLVFLFLDVLDREVPLDLALFQFRDDGLVPYADDLKPTVAPQHSQRFAGHNKFLAARLFPGDYYLRVRANHPAYQLRSETYPVPPHHPELMGGLEPAAQTALRSALDYLTLKGDSWHANTPRSGAVDHRVRNLHAETAQCSACHTTHFPAHAQLVGAANGYPVRQRAALEFLSARLYNSPRPLYGHPQAVWGRTSGATAGALSRLSVILDLYEKQVSFGEGLEPHRSVAEFLKLHYQGRSELPPPESDRNQPLISAFQVGLHSWMVFDELFRRTGDPEYARWRGEIRHLIDVAPNESIANLSDLCFQTIAFSVINPEFYQERIGQNVERIFSYQREDGQWPMGFEETDPSAEFQTAHSLYTLALAGVPRTDPRVEKALFYLLSRQRSFGGWLDDDDRDFPHPHESWQTPFRETQFAIMALSQYFPGPGEKGRQADLDPFSNAQKADSWSTRLVGMDRIWNRPGENGHQQILSDLTHPNALVRQKTAVCLGRVGKASAVEPLVNALRDPSKLVRRAAAFALRQLGNRGIGKDRVVQALMSENPWTRRGAVQIFTQHHKSWTDRQDVREALMLGMRDADSWIRMMSARALWQWWYWDASENSRSRIEDIFLERLKVESHPWVGVNLKEGLHNLLDENLDSLYADWIPALGEKLDRQQVIAEHGVSTLRQAGKLAGVLQRASPPQASRLLESLRGFHLRHSSGDGKGSQPLGSDVETIRFDGAAARALHSVLRKLLTSPEVNARRAAFRAAYTLRGNGSNNILGLPFLRALRDPDAQVRQAAWESHLEFIPKPDVFTESAIVQTLESLIREGSSENRRQALQILPNLRLSLSGGKGFARIIKATILRGSSEASKLALRTMPGLPILWRDLAMVHAIGEKLDSGDWERQRAVLGTILQIDALGGLDSIQERLEQIFLELDPVKRDSLLRDALTEPRLAGNARVAGLVVQALQDENQETCELALELAARHDSLRANAAVRESLQDLSRDENYRIRRRAQSLIEPRQLRGDTLTSETLSLEFFEKKVQPIFFLPGLDGKTCAGCHHNHGVLKLTAPEGEASPSPEMTLQNYQSALKVVNLIQPEKSLILVKPVSTAMSEGVGDPLEVCHGGDLRWPEREQSEHYRIILSWIKGVVHDSPVIE